jgi:hypothetical protein
MIISISGKIGSGKDTIAEIIKQEMPAAGWEVKKFAGKLKEIATLLTSIPVTQFEDQSFKQTLLPEQWNDANGNAMTVRDLLQRLGTEAMRSGLHENVWVNALMSDLEPNSNWIITDTRFPNEIDACVHHGAITILVQRDLSTTPLCAHASETALDQYDQWDYIINNTGSMQNLRRKVGEILRENPLTN